MIIWGLKTVALFDVWSFEHLLSGLSIGHLVKNNNSKVFKKFGLENIPTRYFDVIGVFLAAFFWESIEHYLETGLAGNRVQYWFQGVEFWGNRLITDPLLLVLGYLIVKKYPKLVYPSRALSAIWLFINVFYFPHSMYFQEVIEKLI